MRLFLYLILINSFFIWMLACDENNEPDKQEEFRVIHVMPSDGYFILYPSGLEPSSAYVQFNAKVASANMMINGASVDAFSNDNRTYTIPGDLIVTSIFGAGIDCIDPHNPDTRPPSSVTLTVEAEDKIGRSLEGYAVDWRIAIYDYWPPTICSSKCIPENDAVDVDPDVYPERLVIAFNEPVVQAALFGDLLYRFAYPDLRKLPLPSDRFTP